MIPIEEIKSAQKRIKQHVLRYPVVPLHVLVKSTTDHGDDGKPIQIFLKYENLQVINSFKLRAACNHIMIMKEKGQSHEGVWTASAGNMAAGVAWMARELSVPCTVVVHNHAADAKIEAIKRINKDTKIVKVSWDKWWKIIETHRFEDQKQYDWDFGFFIHPVCSKEVRAGNGTIGLEILEDLPDVDTIIVPYGGGALSTGIASAVKSLRPQCKVYACEVETAAPLQAALERGHPTPINYQPSFVDGIGSGCVINEMWPIAKALLAGSLVASVEEVASAIKVLVENNKIVAEGAGACSVAAALKYAHTGMLGRKIVCVISGGGLDTRCLIEILQGRVPKPKM